MTLKNCPCCRKLQTTKTAKFRGREMGMLWFDCRSCLSTFVLKARNWTVAMMG